MFYVPFIDNENIYKNFLLKMLSIPKSYNIALGKDKFFE